MNRREFLGTSAATILPPLSRDGLSAQRRPARAARLHAETRSGSYAENGRRRSGFTNLYLPEKRGKSRGHILRAVRKARDRRERQIRSFRMPGVSGLSPGSQEVGFRD